MKKFKNLFISYGLAFLTGYACYFFSSNLIICLIVGVLMFLLINFYTIPKLINIMKYRSSLLTFSHFANSLIMQITVTPNASTAINEISNFLNNEEKEILQNEELLVKEKLEAIEKNYEFPLYQVFKEIIVLYDTQGGDIIDMSLQLLRQIDDYIKNVEEIYLDNIKKISEVLVLWGFAFGVIIYIKEIMKDYYMQIILNQSFQMVIGIFFMMFIITLFILSKKYIEIRIG